MGIKLSNNAFATLAAGINSSATSITVTSGQGARFPTLSAGDYFYATLIDTSNNLEIVKCTARSTDVLTVVRGQESTTARAYSAGDRIEIRLTAQTFIDAAGVVDGSVTAIKMAAGAAVGNLGFTPVNKAGDTMGGALVLPNAGVPTVAGFDSVQAATVQHIGTVARRHGYFGPSANGSVWCRVALLEGRLAYRIHVDTTGGWYGPGYTSFIYHLDYSNTQAIGGVVKLNSQYVTYCRYQSNSSGGGVYYLELYFNGVSNLQGFYVAVENLCYGDQSTANFSLAGSGANGGAPVNGTFGTNLSNLTYTGSSLAI